MKRYIKQSGATKTPTFEVIRDDDGDVRAYKLGKWYLCKIYSWGDTVNWYIFDHQEIALSGYEKSKLGYAKDSADGQGLVYSCRQGKQILIDRYNEAQNSVTAATEEPTNSPEYYYQIMNLLDEIALADRFPTTTEKQQLNELLAKDGGTIEDMADANDCYNTDDELCHTWDEMVSALHILFEHGDRV